MILAGLVMTAAGCGKKTGGDQGIPVAEFRGEVLYSTDLPQDIWKKYNENDSAGMLRPYIDKWLETRVLVAEAEEKLNEEQKNKDKLIEDYRNSLLIYELQQQMIREKLDTGVTDEEIKTFYEENRQAFILKKNIVKIRYIKIAKQGTDVAKLKKLMQTPGHDSEPELRSIAEEKAENFYLDTNWLYLDDIMREVPINPQYDQQRFLTNNRFVQIEENEILYLLFIIDFRIRDAVSPLEFERDKIRDIILYRRKLKFIKDAQRSLFEKAVEQGEIKYITPRQ